MRDEHDKSLSTLLVLMVVLAILGVACWNLLAQPGLGPYGAIAMSDSSLSTGGSWGYADPSTATRRSIAECNKASGGNDCAVKVSLKNDCAVLAISVQHNASFLGQSHDQATSTAMVRCQASGATDCAVHENICSSIS
jgi:hypothetical protein